MPKDPEKYQYFTVGLLKDSFALEALKADAEKHHMIDQLPQLIALRLTEYYDLLVRVTPALSSGQCSTAKSSETGTGFETSPSVERDSPSDEDEDEEADIPSPDEPVNEIVSASPNAEQNADEAAEYWVLL